MYASKKNPIADSAKWVKVNALPIFSSLKFSKPAMLWINSFFTFQQNQKKKKKKRGGGGGYVRQILDLLHFHCKQTTSAVNQSRKLQ